MTSPRSACSEGVVAHRHGPPGRPSSHPRLWSGCGPGRPPVNLRGTQRDRPDACDGGTGRPGHGV